MCSSYFSSSQYPRYCLILYHSTRIHTISLKKAFCPRVFQVGMYMSSFTVVWKLFSNIFHLETMRLSHKSRLRVIGHIEVGWRYWDVAADFGVHEPTIGRLHRRYQATGSVADGQRPGQPCVTSARQDRYMCREHQRNRFQLATVTARNTRGWASTLIWGGIWHDAKTDFVFLNNSVGRGGRGGAKRGLTAQRYIDEVLRPVAVPFLRQRPGMLLHKDNARPHVARVTTQYLRQNNINVTDDWTALSADLRWKVTKLNNRVRGKRITPPECSIF